MAEVAEGLPSMDMALNSIPCTMEGKGGGGRKRRKGGA
jgi:hypothetical protein